MAFREAVLAITVSSHLGLHSYAVTVRPSPGDNFRSVLTFTKDGAIIGDQVIDLRKNLLRTEADAARIAVLCLQAVVLSDGREAGPSVVNSPGRRPPGSRPAVENRPA
jgi:hypothetical protein